jgi:hypothetical protein
VSDSKLTKPFSKVSDTLDTDRGRSLYLSEGSLVTKITLYRELNEAVQDQHFPAPAVFSGRAFHFSLRGCMNFSVASTESSTLAEAEAVTQGNYDTKSPQDGGSPCFILCDYSTKSTMAGVVRQPIDIPSLERYISQNVPEIKIPIDVKQVLPPFMKLVVQVLIGASVVWLWSIESYIPTYGKRWHEICYAQETSGKVGF